MSDFRETLRSWRTYPALHLSTLVVLAATFTVLVSCYSFYKNLDQLLVGWGDSVEISVYLKDGSSEADRQVVAGFLRDVFNLREIVFIPKKQAAARLKDQLGEYVGDLVSTKDFENPLPDSFSAKLESSVLKEDSSKLLLQSLADRLAQLKAVSDVSYGQGWVENYASVVRLFGAASAGLIVILLLAGAFVIGNCIRNSIAQRSEEISVLELVGATPWMIRRPYIYEGITMGGVSAVFALTLFQILIIWQKQQVGEELGFLGVSTFLSSLNIFEIMAFVIFAAGAGGGASFLCVRKLNDGWSASRARIK